jgi:hypothetical protein
MTASLQATSLCDQWTAERASLLAETASSATDPNWANTQIEIKDLELEAFDEKLLRAKYLRMFLSADAVYSSPLTRAVQVRLHTILMCLQAPSLANWWHIADAKG